MPHTLNPNVYIANQRIPVTRSDGHSPVEFKPTNNHSGIQPEG
jgi:hypothetical protein